MANFIEIDNRIINVDSIDEIYWDDSQNPIIMFKDGITLKTDKKLEWFREKLIGDKTLTMLQDVIINSVNSTKIELLADLSDLIRKRLDEI